MSEDQKANEIRRFSSGIYTTWGPIFARMMKDLGECEAMHLADLAIYDLVVRRPDLYPTRARSDAKKERVRQNYERAMQ
jgi:hypothetical protein